jgi:hypothetical protein
MVANLANAIIHYCRLERGIRQEEPTIKHIFIEAESLRGETSQSRVA